VPAFLIERNGIFAPGAMLAWLRSGGTMRTKGRGWRALLAVVAGVLVCFAVYAMFRGDLARHYERIANGSRLVETRCGTVELGEAGQGAPLLIAHGSGGGFDQAMLAGADFARLGWRVIAPSRFGYLRTPFPSDASAAAQADQFACLLDALGVARTAIIGISAGANSAMQFAIRHPRRAAALVLLVPAAYKPGEPAPPATSVSLRERALMTIVGSDFAFWAAMRFAHDTIVRLVLATPPALLQTASVEERQRIERLLNTILPISARARGLVNDTQIAGHPARYALEDIRAPTLIISLRDDLYGTYASAEYTAQHIRGARFIGYEHGGHVWIGHHTEIVEETTRFLHSIEVSGGKWARND
jgi:pimeloyl-ACP methyl ester carboxylesterase